MRHLAKLTGVKSKWKMKITMILVAEHAVAKQWREELMCLISSQGNGGFIQLCNC